MSQTGTCHQCGHPVVFGDNRVSWQTQKSDTPQQVTLTAQCTNCKAWNTLTVTIKGR